MVLILLVAWIAASVLAAVVWAFLCLAFHAGRTRHQHKPSTNRERSGKWQLRPTDAEESDSSPLEGHELPAIPVTASPTPRRRRA